MAAAPQPAAAPADLAAVVAAHIREARAAIVSLGRELGRHGSGEDVLTHLRAARHDVEIVSGFLAAQAPKEST